MGGQRAGELVKEMEQEFKTCLSQRPIHHKSQTPGTQRSAFPHAVSTAPVSIFMDLFQLIRCDTKKMGVQTTHFWVEVVGKKELETLPHRHLYTNFPHPTTAPSPAFDPEGRYPVRTQTYLQKGIFYNSKRSRAEALVWLYTFPPPEKPGWKMKLIM